MTVRQEVLPTAVVPVAEGLWMRTKLRDYLELSKARIVFMVLLTTAAGFALAPTDADFTLLFHTLCGTALIAAGTNALNQVWERDRDALMVRTQHRPLPEGRMQTSAALGFSVIVSVAGIAWLFVAANWLAAALAALTLITYLFIYTPLKTRTTLCTVVGAVPGALPPMIGWAAASGRLDAGAWALFAFMFLWQLPHFLAIGWIYRNDYAKAGFRILSVGDESGTASGRHAIAYAVALVPVSLAPAFLGIAAPVYLVIALMSGAVLLFMTTTFARERTRESARNLFLASNFYLVAVMLVLLVSHAFLL